MLVSTEQLQHLSLASDDVGGTWLSMQLPAQQCATHSGLVAALQKASNLRGSGNPLRLQPEGLPSDFYDLRQTTGLRHHTKCGACPCARACTYIAGMQKLHQPFVPVLIRVLFFPR